MTRQFETVGDAHKANPAKIIIPGPQNEEDEMREITGYSPDYNSDTSDLFKKYYPAGDFNGIATDVTPKK